MNLAPAQPAQMTPRKAAHFSLIQMAIDSHCGPKCRVCLGVGTLRLVDIAHLVVCQYCHGFGHRELNHEERRDKNIGAQMHAAMMQAADRELEAAFRFGAMPR